jgi:uncharacterized membrane protein YeaQ/YmgE (transglycosylase-associated protein family)
MNIALYMLAGAVLGWLGHTYLGYSENRGRVMSLIVGAMGGFFGGKMIAPMFTANAVPGQVSLAALLFAAAVAAAFLAIGNQVEKRWGV